MRAPRKARRGSKKGEDTEPTDSANDEAGSEHDEAGQPKVTSHLQDMEISAIKAHLRHILRRFRARKKGK